MDVRARYSRDIIIETFLELLEDKPINKITVKEICDRAQINRTTFYKHFDNPYDVLDTIEKQLLDDLSTRITRNKTKIIYEVFYIVLKDIYTKRKQYTILFEQSGDKSFRTRIFDLCYDMSIESIDYYFPYLSSKKKDWLYYFLAEGCNGILNQWIEHDFEESPKEIVGFIQLLIDALHHANIK